MSNLFDVANKNVREGSEKKIERLRVIAKTREGYHINQGVDKSGVFSSARPWDEKRVRVYGNAIKARRCARARTGGIICTLKRISYCDLLYLFE